MRRHREEKPKVGPRERWAVYIKHPAKEMGIHKGIIATDGNRGFVYQHGQKRALIIPASSVFDKREDAERHLAHKGPYKWCVANLVEGDGFIMFEARVYERARRGFISSSQFFETVVVARDSALDEKVRKNYALKSFDTKREARRYLVKKVAAELEQAEKEVRDWQARVELLNRTLVEAP